MRKKCAAVLLLSLLFVMAAGESAWAQVVVGQAGGAYYKFAVPPNWTGDLVIWNEGLSLGPIVPFTINPASPLNGLGPSAQGLSLASVQFSQGFALAVTSRRTSGWATFKLKNDLQSMMEAFVTQFGSPKRVIVTGASFGGLAAIQAIETANLGNIVGGMTICGTLAGSRNWDFALDIRLIYDAVCSAVPGAAIPGGAEGLPEGLQFNVPAAVNQCTGALVPANLRTPEQTARLTRIVQLTGIPASFLVTDMGYSTFVMTDLVHDKLNGRIGVENINVDYGDADIERSIARVAAHPAAKHKLEDHYTPSGEVGSAKIVSLHTNLDGLSVVENESDYANKVPATNFTSAIAIESAPSHCGFTSGEVVAAWESLKVWLNGGPQPTAASIQSTCLQLPPPIGGVCRINPSFVVPDINSRIRPRQ